jgi:siroheme synthase
LGFTGDLTVEGKLRSTETLVFYMGLKNILTIQNNLIKRGMNKNTPCAIISNASLESMKSAKTTLENLAKTALDFKPPAIIVVGDTVAVIKNGEK